MRSFRLVAPMVLTALLVGTVGNQWIIAASVGTHLAVWTKAPGDDALYSASEKRDLGRIVGLGSSPSEVAVTTALRDERRVGRMRFVVAPYGAAHLGQYAGLFLTHANGMSYLNVGFTEGVARHRRRLKALVDQPNRLRVFGADHSLAEMELVQTRLVADRDALLRQGIALVSVGIMLMDNRVRVAIAEWTPETRDHLVAQYGSALVVVPGEASR